MKAIVIIMAGLCALVLADPIKSIPRKRKIEDKVFLQRQKDVFRLFKHVNQPIFYKELDDIATAFAPEKNVDKYEDPKYVEDFMQFYRHDILPRGQIFSIFFQEHLRQAIALFKMMYHAKDYDTFFKTSVWARKNVNEGMWLYTFSVALVHREDTFGMILPPIYEVYPFYFFSSEVINKAQKYKQMYKDEDLPKDKDGYEGYTIKSEYSGYYLNLHPEQYLSYFTEDVGLNAYYYYYNIFYPYWLGGDDCSKLKKDRRGEMYYYVHQQLLARYYLERLSGEFSEIPILHLDSPIETGYYPSLEYPNGLSFPVRPNNINVNRHWEYNHPHSSNFTGHRNYVKDYARRIRDAIDFGFVFDRNGKKIHIFDERGFEMLGDMIEGNPDSPNVNFYGSIQVVARRLLGFAHLPLHKYKLAPSALEHFETSLRDPVFYQMYKAIVSIFQQYKRYLPNYSMKDLKCDGIKIENIKIDRLITYADKFHSDLINGVYYNEKTSNKFQARVTQERLNHKPFTYTINADSDKDRDVVVRVFIGPKYDEYGRMIDCNENRMNFFEIDKFAFTMKTGKNAILRSSQQSFLVNDRTCFTALYKRILEALKGKEPLQIDGSESYFGIPKRLLLPAGLTGGKAYQMYVIITPHDKKTETEANDEDMYPTVGRGGFNRIDDKALGFPFDREIDVGTFYVPNSRFEDITIYHKKMEDFNATE